jgi:hypothetical protein
MKASIGAEFLTVVTVKSSIFWDLTPCSPKHVNQRLWELFSSCSVVSHQPIAADLLACKACKYIGLGVVHAVFSACCLLLLIIYLA